MGATAPGPPTDQRQASTGDLLRSLISDLNLLVDKQIQLARQEATENVRTLTRGGMVLAVGAVLLLAAFVSLTVLIIALLSLAFQVWAAAALALLFFAVVGGSVAFAGWRKVRIRPLSHTRETLREDAEWAKHRLTPNER